MNNKKFAVVYNTLIDLYESKNITEINKTDTVIGTYYSEKSQLIVCNNLNRLTSNIKK